MNTASTESCNKEQIAEFRKLADCSMDSAPCTSGQITPLEKNLGSTARAGECGFCVVCMKLMKPSFLSSFGGLSINLSGCLLLEAYQ